jgi:hypothetical protein
MAKFKNYPFGERYDIFRGKGDNADSWYVYDKEEGRYVGGNFRTLTAARLWAAAQ